MNKLKQTLGSRKFLLTLASVVSTGIALYFGIPEEKVAMFVGPLLLWVAGEFHLDAKAIDAKAEVEGSKALAVPAITDAKSATAAFDAIGKTE